MRYARRPVTHRRAAVVGMVTLLAWELIAFAIFFAGQWRLWALRGVLPAGF